MVVDPKLPVDGHSGSIFQENVKDRTLSGLKCLLIDDEPVCIEIEQEMLESLGYQVTTIQDHTLALRMLEENPNLFDLLVSNTLMPGAAGDAFANELMTINPSIPLVICPATERPTNRRDDVSGNLKSVFRKPITMFEMVRMVRCVQEICLPGI